VPSTREIRRRIRSVKNMTQITRAMEMVSASKMRRAQRNVLATRPYADRLLDVMGELTTNVLRRGGRFILDERGRGRQIETLAVGKKGRDFLVRTGQNLIAEVTKLGDYPRLVEVQLYQAILESIASEHSARMVAMRNATDNARDLSRDLTLSYNKTRQANITKEVSEIASGAAALAE